MNSSMIKFFDTAHFTTVFPIKTWAFWGDILFHRSCQWRYVLFFFTSTEEVTIFRHRTCALPLIQALCLVFQEIRLICFGYNCTMGLSGKDNLEYPVFDYEEILYKVLLVSESNNSSFACVSPMAHQPKIIREQNCVNYTLLLLLVS